MSVAEPVDIFEERARLALMVAGYFQIPVETALEKSTEVLHGLAAMALWDLTHQLRQRMWEATLEANNG